MSSTTRVGFLAGASMLALAGTSFAGTGADIDARIADLEAQIAELRGDTTNEVRTEEIRAIVQDVLADADSRTSLLQSGMVGGWDNGFQLGSSDGNYTLKIKGQIQFRWVLNLQDNSSDDAVYGFENRRTKLEFSGNIVDPSWRYKIKGAFNRNGGGFGLEEAYLQKDLDNGWMVRAGQFKSPLMLEEHISSSKQLAADRSLVNEAFNQDYTQGVAVGYMQDTFRVAAMVHDGIGNRNTAFTPQTVEWAFGARAEFLFAGTWKQFEDFTSKRGSDYGAKLGFGVNYQKAAFGTTTPDELEDLRFTGDFQVEGDGWNVAVMGIIREADDDNTVDISSYGLVVQGGYYFTEDLEGFARYEHGDADTGGTQDDLSVITVGVNKYFAGHNAKWTTDLGFGLDEVGGAWSSSGAGWLSDTAGEDGQIVLRTQFQLLF